MKNSDEKIPYIEGKSLVVLEKIRAKKTFWFHNLSRNEKVALNRLLAFNIVEKIKTNVINNTTSRISYILKPVKGSRYINESDIITL